CRPSIAFSVLSRSNPRNCPYELVSGIRESFEILRCFALLRSGKGFVESLKLFIDTFAQIFRDAGAHRMISGCPESGIAKAFVDCKMKFQPNFSDHCTVYRSLERQGDIEVRWSRGVI